MGQDVRITIRLPGNLHTTLAQTADEDGRSLNSQLVFALQQFLRRRSMWGHYDGTVGMHVPGIEQVTFGPSMLIATEHSGNPWMAIRRDMSTGEADISFGYDATLPFAGGGERVELWVKRTGVGTRRLLVEVLDNAPLRDQAHRYWLRGRLIGSQVARDADWLVSPANVVKQSRSTMARVDEARVGNMSVKDALVTVGQGIFEPNQDRFVVLLVPDGKASWQPGDRVPVVFPKLGFGDTPLTASGLVHPPSQGAVPIWLSGEAVPEIAARFAPDL